MSLVAFAPAKVNLWLHVGPPDPEGYHPLSSLVVFADVGDSLKLETARHFELVVEGPFAAAIDPGENLIEKAARALAARLGLEALPARLTLTKRLPVAAGLGGGSADAGAALRLLRRGFNLQVDDAGLSEIAAVIGADGPMCLWSRPALAEGRGERLLDPPELPPLHTVLVNPGAPSPTGAVYRAYDASGAPGAVDRPNLFPQPRDASSLAVALTSTRNDLEPPAVRLEPRIGLVLERLRAAPEALFTRMSGSGATVFGLCRDAPSAGALAERLRQEEPGWWVAPCRLGGPWPEDTPGV